MTAMNTNTEQALGSAMILSPLNANQVTALAMPRTVDEVLGAATSDDILYVLRQGVKDGLTEERNEISGRLVKNEQQITTLRLTYDAIGPTGIAGVDTDAAQQIANLMSSNGFGKTLVKVTFDGRDEDKKHFTYTIKITDPKDTTTYGQAYCEKTIIVAFTAEAKKLQKQIVDLLKVKQGIEKELMTVKKNFGNIDEHIASARAELGKKRITKLQGGAELLASLTKRKPVVATTASEAAA